MNMTRLWSFLESLFSEAEYHGYKKGQAPKPPKAKSTGEYKDELLRYVTHHYSEHDADDVAANMQRLSPQALQQYLDQHYVDPEMNAIVKKMVDVAIAANPRLAGKGEPKARQQYTTASSSADKGSGEAEPIPQRPDRAGTGFSPPSKPSTTIAPGEKPVHAVGSAGQHRPKPQDSVAQGIAPIKMQPGQTRSGLVASQKEVDRLTAAGETQRADALARKLGIPTSAERKNDDGKVVVWSPDRVLRFMSPDNNPKADAERKASAAKDEPITRMDLIKHGLLQRQGAGTNKPTFKGKFQGQVWSPHGQSYMKNTARPDQATGNFAYGKTLVDPSKTGDKLVWDKASDDWVPKDEYDKKYPPKDDSGSKGLARRAWKASQHPPTRGVHSGGTPVLTTSPESIPRDRRTGADSAATPHPKSGAPSTIETGLSPEQGATRLKVRYIPDQNKTKVMFAGGAQENEPMMVNGRVSPEQALKWYLSQFSDADEDEPDSKDDFEGDDPTDPDIKA